MSFGRGAPEPVKKQVIQRRGAFRAIATCDMATLDKVMAEIGQTPRLASLCSAGRHARRFRAVQVVQDERKVKGQRAGKYRALSDSLAARWANCYNHQEVQLFRFLPWLLLSGIRL